MTLHNIILFILNIFWKHIYLYTVNELRGAWTTDYLLFFKKYFSIPLLIISYIISNLNFQVRPFFYTFSSPFHFFSISSTADYKIGVYILMYRNLTIHKIIEFPSEIVCLVYTVRRFVQVVQSWLVALPAGRRFDFE